jgi:two-component sensor histidine kinase
MTASLLSMQKDLCADGTAQKALQTAHDRIYSMASVHNLFYQSNSFSNIDIGAYLGDIIANVRQSYNRDACTVRIVHEIQPFEIGLERAIPLGLIINELITNSYKHAFAGRREGTIRLSIGPENTECLVAYSDDGVGLAAAADQVQGQGQDQAKRGLGMELVRILMGQLGGAMTVENNGGYRVVLRFPRQ